MDLRPGHWLILLCLLALPASAQELPQQATDTHLGVASCAGSTCHGAIRPHPGANVRQNEFVTWQKKDAHARAYTVLLNAESRRIARNLGLGAAESAPLCLDCHADNAAASHRGSQFQIADGVACESCHGGAERWLGPHVAAQGGHAANVAAGMYPTEDAKARARLCLSCHFGNAAKLVTHRIMGAGHPRTSFELDTFTAIQPAHFVVDDDYRQRKKVESSARLWAVGQGVALSELLAALMDPARNHDGILPELVLFDCHACHTKLTDKNWRPGMGAAPGVPRLQDSGLLMLRVATAIVDDGLAQRLRREGQALDAALLSGFGAVTGAARQLKGSVDKATDLLAAHDFTAADLKAMVKGLADLARRGELVDYADGEQAAMAAGSLLAGLKLMGEDGAGADAALDRVFNAVDDEYGWRPAALSGALADLAGAVDG